MAKPIIILGSHRSNGKTFDAVNQIFDSKKIEMVDLAKLNISPYDYEHKNKGDDYLPLMRRVVANHNVVVLATPVYWYSVSTIMKIFIDRVSDLLSIEKDTGRKLRGKKLYLIASFNTSLPKDFESPIEQTCKYLGMEYLGCSYICSDPQSDLSKFNNSEIEKAKKIIFGD